MNGPAIEIRWGGPPESILEVRQRNLYPDKPLVHAEAIRPFVENPTAICVAAVEGNQFIGCAAVMEDFLEGKLLRIRWLGVDESRRGQRVGTALIQRIQEHARKQDEAIWCNVRLRAIPMYERLGFQIEVGKFEIAGVGPHVRMVWQPSKSPPQARVGN